jgi:Carboxypeptidase regulatory-like domain
MAGSIRPPGASTLAAALVAVLLAAPAAAPGQQPARDAPATPLTGTASIGGVVVSDDAAAHPVRRALVRIFAPGLRGGRVAVTDDQGRFVIADLPAARYTLTASKPGWVTAYYGTKQSWKGPSAPITLDDGQPFTLRLRMLHGGVLSGTVFDESARPSAGVRVAAAQFATVAGHRQLRVVGGFGQTTDDLGRYRLYGLAPGDYVLVADAGSPGNSGAARQVTDAEVDWAVQRARSSGPTGAAAGGAAPEPPRGPALGYAPVFYPGTVDQADAETVTLGAAEERDGLDFHLRHVPVARVAGVVTGPNGRPPATVQINLISDEPQVLPGLLGGGLAFARPNPAGEFTFNGVRPGRYVVAARAAGRAGGPGRAAAPPARDGLPGPTLTLWALAKIDVTGDDITGLHLDLQPGMTVSGRVVFEGAAPPPAAPSVRIGIGPAERDGAALLVPAVPAHPDGTFELQGVTPGTYRLTATAPGNNAGGPSWMARSAVVDGRDLLESSLEVVGGQDVSGIVVTFTDRVTEISGRLLDAAGQPAPDFAVLVFTTDRSLWGQPSRRIRLVRPGRDGRFSVTGLPPGEYFLAALTDATADIADPSLLDQIAALSYRFTLAEGEKKTQDLKVGGGG